MFNNTKTYNLGDKLEFFIPNHLNNPTNKSTPSVFYRMVVQNLEKELDFSDLLSVNQIYYPV